MINKLKYSLALLMVFGTLGLTILSANETTPQVNKQDDHAGHDHAEGEHDEHAGHDHAEGEHDEHEGHDHAEGEHDEHEGHDHAEGEHDEHEGHDHAEGEHDDAKAKPACDADLSLYVDKTFTEVEVLNLRIKTKPLSHTSYVTSESIAAEIKMIPQNIKTIYAPWSGRVKSISAVDGAKAEAVMIQLVRDAIPRVELNLVANILEPASESFHELISNLTLSRQQLKNIEAELKQLTNFDQDAEFSLVPQKELRGLRYEKINLKRSIENDLQKLKFHGYEAGKGRVEPTMDRLWLSALKANKLWNSLSENLFKVLPTEMQSNAWAVATIGELTAASLLDENLIQWLKSNQGAGHSFLEIGGLIQRGYTTAALKELYVLNVFDQEVNILTPVRALGWDVQTVKVRVGQSVSQGDELLVLADQSKMHLIATPLGSELTLVRQAIQHGYLVAASPLTVKAGPSFTGLQIMKVGSDASGKTEVTVLVDNKIERVNKTAGASYRSWGLHNGLRYNLAVPVTQMDEVYVLPLVSLIETVADHFVFVQTSKLKFEKRPVVLLHKDSDSVVLGLKSKLKPGEKVVTSGAFALSLAFLSETPSAVDPHAGHNH